MVMHYPKPPEHELPEFVDRMRAEDGLLPGKYFPRCEWCGYKADGRFEGHLICHSCHGEVCAEIELMQAGNRDFFAPGGEGTPSPAGSAGAMA
jgi:hypothetical protein